MKKVPTILLVVSLFMIGIALAAPTINMYLLTEDDCRLCHDSADDLKNTNHIEQHANESYDSCVNDDCHEIGARKLNCMESECHNATGVYPVTNHHDFEAMGFEDCFTCHEKGVPRGDRIS